MPIDRPDESEVREAGTATLDVPTRRVPAETRDRATYETQLRAAVAADRWQATIAEFKQSWAEHQRRWPEAHPESPDARKHLTRDASDEIDRGCDRIRDVEQRVITPALLDIAAEDPNRELVGLDHRLKGPDRLKEKVEQQMESRPGLAAEQALSAVPDAVRFTFCYTESRYGTDVRLDIDRLHAMGFELVKPLKNSWGGEQYRGINSQWREPQTGVRFEVQFHTYASFEAKQVTHGVYERLRTLGMAAEERAELLGVQNRVCRQVPIPLGAVEIEDDPRREPNG